MKKNVKVLNPADYPDSPDAQRVLVLSIYVAWNGAGGETWAFETSVNGIIEESSAPPSRKPEQDEDGFIIIEDVLLPGGRDIWFKGTKPGDVVLTIITKSNKGKIVDIQQHAIRVYQDLKLSLLHTETESFRD